MVLCSIKLHEKQKIFININNPLEGTTKLGTKTMEKNQNKEKTFTC